MSSAIDIDLNAQSLSRAVEFPGQIILSSHDLKQMTADLVAACGLLENGLYISSLSLHGPPCPTQEKNVAKGSANPPSKCY